jgi:hypothetical protein
MLTVNENSKYKDEFIQIMNLSFSANNFYEKFKMVLLN